MFIFNSFLAYCKRNTLAYLTGILAVSFIGIFFFYPLLIILIRSFCHSDNISVLVNSFNNCHFDAFSNIIQNSYYQQRLVFTLYQAFLSTLLTLILALPNAFLFAFFDFKAKRLLRSLFTIPFVMPTVVASIGFLALLGPRGVWNLQNTLIIILLAHVFYNYVLVVRIVSASLEHLAPQFIEAAAVLGASAKQRFFRITLPLAYPAILAATSLVFIFSFTSFGIILILAPEIKFATLEVEIYRLSKSLQLDKAAVIVLLQLVVASIFTGIYTLLQKRLATQMVIIPHLKKANGIWKFFIGVNVFMATCLILAPLLALSIKAFWIEGKLSLKSLSYLLEAQHSIGFIGVIPALFNSLWFAAMTTIFATVIGFIFAYSIVKVNWFWLDNISLLPLASSSVTLGFGYLLSFPQLIGSVWSILLAHCLISFPFVVRSLLPAMRALPQQLTDTARTLGARPLKIIFQIEFPLLIPAFITAASFAFTISLGEFGASLVLSRPEYATLPVAIFDRFSKPGINNYSSALVLSVLLMIVTVSAILIIEYSGKSKSRSFG